ncbi:MAG: hypothetical protein ACK6DS_08045, partial [Planctomycetota bacterium]
KHTKRNRLILVVFFSLLSVVVLESVTGGNLLNAPKGGIVAQNGTTITGYTKHGINRATGNGLERAGTSPKAILEALKNPKNIKSGVDDLGRPFEIFTGPNARVVVNPQTGEIISVNPLGGGGVRGR